MKPLKLNQEHENLSTVYWEYLSETLSYGSVKSFQK